MSIESLKRVILQKANIFYLPLNFRFPTLFKLKDQFKIFVFENNYTVFFICYLIFVCFFIIFFVVSKKIADKLLILYYYCCYT